MAALQSAIRDAIFSEVLSGYHYESEKFIFLSRVWPGQPISESQYSGPWSPTNPSGKQAVTETLSRFVDPIPNFSSNYSPSGRKVEEEYSGVLGSARQFGGGPGQLPTRGIQTASVVGARRRFASEVSDRVETEVETPDGRVIRTFALAQTAQSRNNLDIKYANQVAQLSTVRAIQQRSVPAEGQDLHTEVARLESNLLALGRARNSSQNALDGLQEAQLNDEFYVARAFYKASNIFKISELSSLSNPGLNYHPSYLSPDTWTDKDSSSDWPFIKIPFDGGSLSLTFSRVDIVRPWFLMSLFDLPDWQVSPGSGGPGSLSNGDTMNNDGSFALLPVSMIVARDISAVDSSGATSFRAPGLQILAWVNKIMPYSPPLLPRPSEDSGSVLVTNRGAFISRFSVAWARGGRPATRQSGNFPVLAAKSISIPAEAKNISITIEVMTSLLPETWQTLATREFDRPVRKCFELTGTIFDVKFTEVVCAG
jgi:hypothetical protein